MSKIRQVAVYKGMNGNEIVHIGITTQDPKVRFRTHEKRKLIERFEVITLFEEVEDALALEKELILKYKPKYSKRIKQNDNRPKSKAEIEARKGDSTWCQSCLKRRVNKGYRVCCYCS